MTILYDFTKHRSDSQRSSTVALIAETNGIMQLIYHLSCHAPSNNSKLLNVSSSQQRLLCSS